MKKGMTGERMVFLVVAVCLGLFILWFLLSRLAPSLIQQLEWLLGISKPTDVELAAMCSIYRCTDGCMSMRVQEISWKSGDKTLNCQDFCGAALPSDAYNHEPCICQPGTGKVGIDKCGGFCENAGSVCNGNGECTEKTDTELKICGSGYPVNITLKKNEKIDLSHLALGSSNIPDVGCIIPSNAGSTSGWDILAAGGWNIIGGPLYQALKSLGILGDSDLNWLVINVDLIKSYGDKVECKYQDLTVTHDSVKEIAIGPTAKSPNIKISTQLTNILGRNFVVTYVNPE